MRSCDHGSVDGGIVCCTVHGFYTRMYANIYIRVRSSKRYTSSVIIIDWRIVAWLRETLYLFRLPHGSHRILFLFPTQQCDRIPVLVAGRGRSRR